MVDRVNRLKAVVASKQNGECPNQTRGSRIDMRRQVGNTVKGEQQDLVITFEKYGAKKFKDTLRFFFSFTIW